MKTKQICVMDVVVTKLFAAALALFLIFAFSTCDNDSTRKKPGTKKYKVGDTGPGGGTVFYDSFEDPNINGYFDLYMEDGTVEQVRYLELGAELGGEEGLQWASAAFYNVLIEGLETTLGTGRKNTALILRADPNAPAAKACSDLPGGDWFLPSIDELGKVRSYLPGTWHWASSQYNNIPNQGSVVVYQEGFNATGVRISGSTKESTYRVRAIRAF